MKINDCLKGIIFFEFHFIMTSLRSTLFEKRYLHDLKKLNKLQRGFIQKSVRHFNV